MGNSLILVSCSNGKIRGGAPDYSHDHSILSQLSPEIRARVLERRHAIYQLISGGMVEDRLRGDGNRRDSRYNLELKAGPDMDFPDAPTDPGRYMPAYQRYDGRFFAHAGIDALEQAILQDCHVLIVSGLYGPVTLEEPVQAYNCHLDDEVIRDAEGVEDMGMRHRISDIWSRDGLASEMIRDFIDHHLTGQVHGITRVIDLLSETSYQRLFDWNDLHAWFRERKIAWFHRVVNGIREPGFLADLGRYFRHDLVEQGRRPDGIGKINRDYLKTIQDTPGASLEFSKEVLPDPYTARMLQRHLGDRVWYSLDSRTRDDLIHGEIFFQLSDARSSRMPDEPAPRIVNFFSALENELHIICGEAAGKGSLGGFAHHLCEGSLTGQIPDVAVRRKLCSNLDRIIQIRNRMSHRGTVTRPDLVEARNRILQKDGLLSDLVNIRRGLPP